jgi:hypothetical protein
MSEIFSKDAYSVAQLVAAFRYNLEGRGFDSSQVR